MGNSVKYQISYSDINMIMYKKLVKHKVLEYQQQQMYHKYEQGEGANISALWKSGDILEQNSTDGYY